MKILKRDFQAKKYNPYTIPDNRHTPLLEELYNDVNCASCGRIVCFGECYTSMSIHNSVGFGFPVCEKCYSEEYRLKKLYDRT